MYVLASNGNKLVIVTHKVLRDRITGLSLEITVDRSTVKFDEVESFFNQIIDESLTLEVYNDNDEKVQSLRGFSLELYIGVKGGVFDVNLKCDSENTYQIGILQDKTSKQENIIAEQTNVINSHGEALTAQHSELENQKQASLVLAEQSFTQSDTLDVIISEVIPTAIEVSVETAVAMIMERLDAILNPPVEDEEEIPTDEPEKELVEDEVVEDESTEEEPITGEEPVEE